MSNIRIDLEATVIDGQALTFKSPVDCSQITGLIIYYPVGETKTSKVFQFADAHGNNVGSVSLFAANVLVKVILDTALNRAYVQNADTNKYIEETFLKRSGGTMTGPLAMGSQKITGLATPTADTDAATKKYADDLLANSDASNMLPKAGGTMSGAIAMGGNKITGLGTPTADTDAAHKKYVDDGLSGKAASSHNHSASNITSGILPLERGGTGRSDISGAPNHAIIRKTGDGTASLYYTATGNGAFYATAANGAAKFGTLPIAQGGTGATSAPNARKNLGLTAFSTYQQTGVADLQAGINNVWGSVGNTESFIVTIKTSGGYSYTAYGHRIDANNGYVFAIGQGNLTRLYSKASGTWTIYNISKTAG